MRINDNFVLQEMVDEHIVVPVGEAADKIHGIIRLNATGAFLWKLMSQKDQTEEELITALTAEYATDAETAKKDIDSFVSIIKEFGCISE